MADVENGDNIEFEEPTGQEDDAKAQKKQSSAKRKGADSQSKTKKVRLTIEETEEGRLTSLMNTLKDRGVKNPDLGHVVAEALATIPEPWWEEKLDELTPLEWKVQAALDNPDMREKLVTLLEGKK
jgi:predicted TIM-barrel fold metal-dependent hydrolase